MMRKFIQVIASITFVVSFILLILCLIIAVDDTVSAIETGEFKRLPVFNTVNWIKDINKLSKEEQDEVWNKSGAYFLNEVWKDEHMEVWYFINSCTASAFDNLLIYHLLYYFKIRFRKFFSVLVWTNCLIALILILSARIYAGSGDLTLNLSYMFPAAYSIFRWSFNFVISIIFIVFTHFMKHAERTRKAILLYFRTHADEE